MAYKTANPNLSPQLHRLQSSIGGVQASMRRFNRLIFGQPQRTSSSRMVRGYRDEADEGSILEQLGAPLLTNLFSRVLGDASGNQKAATSYARMLSGSLTGGTRRSSQGQIMADLASAISRANRRNL